MPIEVNPSTYDEDKIVVTDPEMKNYTNGTSEIISQVKYLDNNNHPRDFYWIAPTETCFGFNNNYEYKKPSIPTNLKGMQVCYSMGSQLPLSPQEADHEKFINSINKKVAAKAIAEAGRENLKIPESAQILIERATDKFKDIHRAVKPIIEYPKFAKGTENAGKINLSKPKRMYPQLVTKGRGLEMTVQTKVKGPGNKYLDPNNYVSVTEPPEKKVTYCGDITPVLKVNKVYWGGHGQDSPYAVSTKIQVLQCNFTPRSGNSVVPDKDLLPSNDDECGEDLDMINVVSKSIENKTRERRPSDDQGAFGDGDDGNDNQTQPSQPEPQVVNIPPPASAGKGKGKGKGKAAAE
jgi:hypothetical protein